MGNDATQESANRIDLMADDAIVSPDEDLLDRDQFALRVVEVFERASRQSPSVVFGLLGPWGSGKTSVLHLVQDAMSDAKGWTTVTFNPWEVSDLASLVREFMSSVGSALPSSRDGKRARRALARYTAKIAPFTSVLSFVGVDPSKAVDAAAEALAGDQSLGSVRDELAGRLAKNKTLILVLIDDVDRLEASELALLLKLVRLVGRLPNVYYLLAYDEATVIDVLSSTDVAADRHGRALAYLEKIVQVRLDLPPVHITRISELIDRSLGQLIEDHELAIPESEMRRFGHAYFRHLKTNLKEPTTCQALLRTSRSAFPACAGRSQFR